MIFPSSEVSWRMLAATHLYSAALLSASRPSLAKN
jgi:hypothetical protein